MRIYTKTGDDGTTGLFGGRRVSKAALRVESYGTVDELNAILGWVRATDGGTEAADAILATAQEACFRLGAFVATVPGKDPGIAPLTNEDVTALEAAIDAAEEGLPALTSFILPGGTEAGSRMHVARTVCRRAERALVALAREDEVDMVLVRWLNRLSDLLFVLARRANHDAGVADVPWVPRGE
ncbi:MAG: cob(I)yrinic acid a,c-diamide adenosyltransferase [Planctomycetota bacterium]|nr:cob(I)yrinic acid a,c-diamide adenosyltransferase [Planctomycetota bacterium]